MWWERRWQKGELEGQYDCAHGMRDGRSGSSNAPPRVQLADWTKEYPSLGQPMAKKSTACCPVTAPPSQIFSLMDFKSKCIKRVHWSRAELQTNHCPGVPLPKAFGKGNCSEEKNNTFLDVLMLIHSHGKVQ